MRWRRSGLAIAWLLLAAPVAAQCVQYPMTATDKAYALSQSTFLDAAYVNNQPAPCVAHGQQADAPPTWTFTFPAPADVATVASYKLLFYVATSGYWQADVAAGAAPEIVANVGKPPADASGTVTVAIAPALALATTYRLAIVEVHADGSESVPTPFSDPFDDMPCFCAGSVVTPTGPASPINLRIGG